jgi:hypothetical protein
LTHLAGEMAVKVLEAMLKARWLTVEGRDFGTTRLGAPRCSIFTPRAAGSCARGDRAWSTSRRRERRLSGPSSLRKNRVCPYFLAEKK